MLKKKRLKYNKKDDSDVPTPSTFFDVCSSGNEQLVKYLMKQQSVDDINKEYSYDNNESGNKSLIKYLVEKHYLDVN